MSEAAARARRMPALEAARDVGIGTTRKMEAADAAAANLAAALRELPTVSEDVDAEAQLPNRQQRKGRRQHAEAPGPAASEPGPRIRQVLRLMQISVNCLCRSNVQVR